MIGNSQNAVIKMLYINVPTKASEGFFERETALITAQLKCVERAFLILYKVKP